LVDSNSLREQDMHMYRKHKGAQKYLAPF